jgi:hypothetical protein
MTTIMTPLKESQQSSSPCLKELGNGSNTCKSKNSHVDADNASSILLIVTVAAPGRAVALLTTVLALIGLLVVGCALLLTIDLLVLLEVVEVVTELLNIGGRGNNDTATNLVKLGKFHLLEATSEGNTTGDLLELGEIINSLKLGVVLDGETAANLLEGGEGNVGELVHVDKGQGLRDRGQVGGGERLELGVGAQLQALGHLLESRDLEGLGARNLDLGSSLELVHGNFHNVVAIVEDQELGSNINKVRVEDVHLSVVVNLEALDTGDAETAKITDEGVGNSNALDLSNAFGTEVQLAESGKLDEAKLAKALERREVEVVESLEVVELELSGDGINRGTGDRDKVTGVLGLEVALDLLGAVDDNGTSNRLVNDDIGVDNIAADDLCRFGDLDVLGTSGSRNGRDTEGRNGREDLNGMHSGLICKGKGSCDFVGWC